MIRLLSRSRNTIVCSRSRFERKRYKTRSSRYHSDGQTQQNAQQAQIIKEKPYSSRLMSSWLFLSAGCVFGIVVVGGITRLTDSGLSMVEWKPLSVVPPQNTEEWEAEFERYKQFPEYKVLFPNMTLAEFKFIFFWEWLHRNLGRGVGVVFGVPFLFYLATGVLRGPLLWKLTALFAMGGLQGFIGWWMVKSGLRHDIDYPRVSQYRLALHLGSAFAIYSGLLWVAMSTWPRVQPLKMPVLPRGFAMATAGIFTLLYTTAVAGAFVAGLDAGLMYNTFPLMGDGVVPEDYLEMEPKWRNMFENGAAVQFNHRVLGVTSVTAISALWIWGRYLPLPPQAKLALNLLGGMGWVQATLGVLTLLWAVPTPIAAAHQSGSLLSISLTLWLLHQALRTRLPIP